MSLIISQIYFLVFLMVKAYFRTNKIVYIVVKFEVTS